MSHPVTAIPGPQGAGQQDDKEEEEGASIRDQKG